MTHRVRDLLSFSRTLQVLTALLTLGLTPACQGTLDHQVCPYATPPGRSFADWQAVFAQRSPIRVTGLVTGWVEAGPEILIDASDERVPDSARRKLWVPSIAYLVEHPKGRVLLDAGVRAGECDYGLRPVYWVPCRNRAGSDAVSQLRSLGLDASDLDSIVISHFHGDHASGLEALTASADVRVISTRAELEAIASRLRVFGGYLRDLIPTRLDVDVIDDALVEMPVVAHAVDFFGDGSLWLIPTPGHTRGHLSALINAAPHPLLLTFDVSHLQVGFDLDVIPGFVANEEQAAESLRRLRALAAAHPEIRVISGHEPEQWSEKAMRVVLIEGGVSS